jgi:protein-tyrosine phosphatase
VFNWLKKNRSPVPPLRVDMHSHLLPGLDDGVATMEDAEAIIRRFISLGYTHIITTPHVMSDTYRNTPETILGRLEEVKAHLRSKGLEISISAAAEYYLDEVLMKMLSDGERLLTFGDRYLLFETNFLTEPFNLKEFIFLATTKGYKLVLAHPERYMYLQSNPDKVQDLIDRGVFMQMNISSLTGYYSKPVQQLAFRLIDKGLIHLLGSDCHHLQHTVLLEQARNSRYFRKALTLPLLNNTLL